MIFARLSLLVLLVAASPAARQYQQCVAMAGQDPVAALDLASNWRGLGGGVAAEHCIALSLAAQQRWPEVAAAIDSLIEHIRARRGVDEPTLAITPQLIAELYAQAGNALLLAGDPIAAYQKFSAALTALPPDADGVEILVDRARSSMASGDFSTAIPDLDQALDTHPERTDIRLLRASARAEVGDIEGARADWVRIAELDPEGKDGEAARAALERLDVRD